jgi:hypothetical protein
MPEWGHHECYPPSHDGVSSHRGLIFPPPRRFASAPQQWGQKSSQAAQGSAELQIKLNKAK